MAEFEGLGVSFKRDLTVIKKGGENIGIVIVLFFGICHVAIAGKL